MKNLRKSGENFQIKNAQRPIKSEPDIAAADNDDAASEIVAGRNAVLEALKSGRPINKILIAKNAGGLSKILDLAREQGIVTVQSDEKKLDKACGFERHQGVVAFCAAKQYCEIDDILDYANERGEPPLIIIADGIEDTHNLGAIIRTACASGAHGVVIPKRRAVGLTAAVSKASAGAVEYVCVARVAIIVAAINELKEKGVWIYALDSGGEQTYFEADLRGAAAIVIGGEDKGVARLVRENSDMVLSIPMKGEISSLNASVAAAVVMYEAVRQRSAAQ